MSDIKKLSDIADMTEYLAERCYYPGEIYDMSGFFFKVYHPEDECRFICSGSRGAIHGVFVVVDDQIIYIEITDNRVDSCIRLDATEHNLEMFPQWLAGKIEKLEIDEFKPGDMQRSVNEILGYADAVMEC